MLEVEFAEAADNLVSLVSDQLCRHLYLQSMAQLHEEENSHKTRKTLPIKRLSCILSNMPIIIYSMIIFDNNIIIFPLHKSSWYH